MSGSDSEGGQDATAYRGREDLAPNELPGRAPGEREQPQGRRNAQGIRVDPGTQAEPDNRRATFSALVEHEPGVLSRIAGLFARRGFNIESLTVGPTADPDLARVTLVADEPEPELEQVRTQLAGLVPVVAVNELPTDAVERELALVKVDAEAPERVAAVAEMFDGDTVDATPEAVTVEVTGSRPKVDAAVEAFERLGVREVKRTGTAALSRGATETTPTEEPNRRDAADESDPADSDTNSDTR